MRSRIIRRLRGVLVTAFSWVVLWLPVGVLIGLVEGTPPECLYCPPNWFLLFLLAWSITAAVSGAAFSIVLMIAERRHSLAELSMARMASWGAIGAAVVPVVLMATDMIASGSDGVAWGRAATVTVLAACLGAACASATLALARRGQASSLAA